MGDIPKKQKDYPKKKWIIQCNYPGCLSKEAQRIEIAISCMRGDDVVLNVCKEHEKKEYQPELLKTKKAIKQMQHTVGLSILDVPNLDVENRPNKDPVGYRSNRQHEPKREAQLLKEAGLSFLVKNNGLHFIVETPIGKVDLYPTTGKWLIRANPNISHRFGAKYLIKYLQIQGSIINHDHTTKNNTTNRI
jgi:hypothetical protein